MAFFPLYPLLIRIVGALAGNHLVAGLLISNAAFFFGLLYLYKLVEHEYDRAVAHRAIFYISIFPTAVFFSAVYTESLFFMLDRRIVLLHARAQVVIAGVVGFFAALTRVEGVLLAVPFVIEWCVARYRRRCAMRSSGRWHASFEPLAGAARSRLDLPSYMAYLWVLRGDPLYFSHVQMHWDRHLAPPWVSVEQRVRQDRCTARAADDRRTSRSKSPSRR